MIWKRMTGVRQTQWRAEDLNRMIRCALGVQILATALYIGLIFIGTDMPLLWGGIYCALACCVPGGCFLAVGKRINRMMEKVDDCITDMIDRKTDDNRENCFNSAEDSLTGKFQSQLNKLYDILKSHEESEKVLRNRISGLVADLVHQMNTPLTNIDMYCGFLMMPELSEDERRRFLEHISAQAEKLIWFGDGFGKAARLETDIMVMKPCRQSLLPIVLEAIGQAAPKAEQCGKEICLEGERGMEVTADAKWTCEAVFNLIDNAVKYGEEGRSIIVSLHGYELYACVEVCSEGNRIPEAERNQVFQRFYRGKTVGQVWEGVGLGLFLVRKIVSGQGGFTEVKDYGERGNCFRIFLPLS